MAKEPIPNNPSDDDLESLAADLLGVSLNDDETELEPFDVGAFDLDDEELDPVEEADAVDEPGPAEAASRGIGKPPVMDADDDFGSSLLDDDALPPPKQAVGEQSAVSDISSANVDFAAATEDPSESVPAPASDQETGSDTYWDALDGFEWEEDGDSKKPTLRKEYVETSETFEDLSIESAEKTDEFIDDADFGAGLDDEVVVTAESAGDSAAEVESAAEEQKGRRSRRGRRRGRRGRSKDSAERSETRETAQEPRRTIEDERDRPAASNESPSDDGFGAGLDDVGDDEEGPKKRRRRRGGRRRARNKTEDRAESPAVSAESDQDDDEMPESTQKEHRRDKYSSVPTWEEAIGYLVRPAPRKAGEGGKSGSRRGRRGRRRSSS